jgi:purine-binding chemotaxis protein CheW
MENEAGNRAVFRGDQFLTFRLDHEIFGVPIDIVREVLDVVPVTRVPGAVKFLKGVINLRGAVVPVADIRIKFGMSATVLTENSCIIVVEVEVATEEGKIVVGLMADQVMEVAELSSRDLQPHPEMGTGISARFLHGLGKLGDNFFMILDVDAIISDEQEDFTATSLPSRQPGRESRSLEVQR